MLKKVYKFCKFSGAFMYNSIDWKNMFLERKAVFQLTFSGMSGLPPADNN